MAMKPNGFQIKGPVSCSARGVAVLGDIPRRGAEGAKVSIPQQKGRSDILTMSPFFFHGVRTLFSSSIGLPHLLDFLFQSGFEHFGGAKKGSEYQL